MAIIVGMEKSKTAIYIDEIMRAIAIWLLSAISLRYFIKELYLIILLATAITMLIILLLRAYYAKKNITKSKIKHIDDCFRELLAVNHGKLLDSLCTALNGTKLGNGVCTQHTYVYPYFCGKLQLENVNYAYNVALENEKKLLILCAETSREVDTYSEIFSETSVSILKKKETYAFLAKYNLLPSIKSRPKKKAKLLKAALKKSKIKGYLFAAFILILTAAFSPYALLCIVAASANITMSILCEIKGD